MSHFRRTYSLKLFDKDNKLMAEISQDARNNFNGLRITFQIQQISREVNSTSEIRVWGLSDETADQLVKADRVELRAGYEDVSGLLHKARVMNVLIQRQQPDLIVSFITFDYIGESTPVGIIFKKTDPQLSAFKQIADKIPGLVFDPNNLQGVSATATLGKGVSVFSDHYLTAFKNVADQLDLYVWVTNGVLYTYPKKQVLPPQGSPLIIHYNNGLIGSPVFNIAQSGVSMQTLLDARYVPNTVFKVASIAPKLSSVGLTFVKFNQEALTRGTWTILKSTHMGDSRGQTWYSMFEAFGTISQRIAST